MHYRGNVCSIYYVLNICVKTCAHQKLGKKEIFANSTNLDLEEDVAKKESAGS